MRQMPPANPGATIDRREALRQAALLLGGALSAPAIAGVLAGCDGSSSSAAIGTDSVLSAAQVDVVATIAEHILPTTDTPGARAAEVHRFIDRMMREYYPPAERQRFIGGLADVDQRARRAHRRAFLECTAEEQQAILGDLDREAFPVSRAVVADASKETERGGGGLPPAAESTRDTARRATRQPPHFFRTMKELTVLGYYTSQIGATKELRHEPIPGRFDGCVPLASVGRTWAV